MNRLITLALSSLFAVGALAACSAAPTESVTTGQSAVTATPMDTPVSSPSARSPRAARLPPRAWATARAP